jgi:3'-phosphoadenosine 5'-phosphosulfate sulfotransferase (PAPS reductase)/FAD synthetase
LSDVSKKNNGDVIFVVNHSGGKDSMHMLGRLREVYPDVETICVTADTGFEHRKPIRMRGRMGGKP